MTEDTVSASMVLPSGTIPFKQVHKISTANADGPTCSLMISDEHFHAMYVAFTSTLAFLFFVMFSHIAHHRMGPF